MAFAIESLITIFSDILNRSVRCFDYSTAIFIDEIGNIKLVSPDTIFYHLKHRTLLLCCNANTKNEGVILFRPQLINDGLQAYCVLVNDELYNTNYVCG